MVSKREIKIKVDYGDDKITPKWIKIPYTLGDICYIKNDPDQNEYIFNGFTLINDNIYYQLGFLGELLEVLDIETSPIKNVIKNSSE